MSSPTANTSHREVPEARRCPATALRPSEPPSHSAPSPVSEMNASEIASRAVTALLDEVYLPGKPGLIGPDGARGHQDMNLDTMVRSAFCLEDTFRELAQAGSEIPPGQELRDLLGQIGRVGEARMMDTTGGINTHRGAIWNLGLIAAATGALINFAPPVRTVSAITALAGSIASISDSFIDTQTRPGATVRKRYGIGGAVSEAATGFPHVHTALTHLTDRSPGSPEAMPHGEDRKLLALLKVMSTLEDTCILHRGGLDGMRFTTAGASAIVSDSQLSVELEHSKLAAFDQEMTRRNLSPGGSADLLACALFLTSIKVH